MGATEKKLTSIEEKKTAKITKKPRLEASRLPAGTLGKHFL